MRGLASSLLSPPSLRLVLLRLGGVKHWFSRGGGLDCRRHVTETKVVWVAGGVKPVQDFLDLRRIGIVSLPPFANAMFSLWTATRVLGNVYRRNSTVARSIPKYMPTYGELANQAVDPPVMTDLDISASAQPFFERRVPRARKVAAIDVLSDAMAKRSRSPAQHKIPASILLAGVKIITACEVSC